MNNEPVYPPLTEEEPELIREAKKKKQRTTEILEERSLDRMSRRQYRC